MKQRNADWRGAYGKTLGPQTDMDTEAKNDERKAATAFVRPFVARFLNLNP